MDTYFKKAIFVFGKNKLAKKEFINKLKTSDTVTVKAEKKSYKSFYKSLNETTKTVIVEVSKNANFAFFVNLIGQEISVNEKYKKPFVVNPQFIFLSKSKININNTNLPKEESLRRRIIFIEVH